MTGNFCVIKSLRRVYVDGKHLIRFQSETFASKLFRKANNITFKIHSISHQQSLLH